MAIKVWLYSRWGEQLELVSGISKAEHHARINGDDTLTLTCSTIMAPGDRLLWSDGHRWREHVVHKATQTHRGEETFTYTCESSLINELSSVIHRRLTTDGTAAVTLASILAGTRWAVDVEASGSYKLELDGKTAYQGLCSMVGKWGLEFEPALTLNGGGVVSRTVRVRASIGSDNGARFSYGRKLRGVTKNVLAEPITACYGYGDGTGDSQLWCYITDDEALNSWGIPDGQGGRRHVDGEYSDTSITAIADLRAATLAYLNEHKVPEISYETDIPFLALENVQLGDTVQVVDTDFTPTLRLQARVGEFTRDLLTGETSSCTFGSVTSVLPNVLARTWSDARNAVALAGNAATVVEDKISQGITTDQATVGQLTITNGVGAPVFTTDDAGNVYIDGKKITTEDSST